MNTAIVTGANGFIGKNVCKSLLKQGISVYAVVRNKESMSELKDDKLFIIEGNLTEIALLKMQLPLYVDTFYHFAWDGASGIILTDALQQIKNITYTCEMLQLAIDIKSKKFIMAGTINELELFQLMKAEKYLPRPACAYGIAKLASDFLCKTLANGKILFNCAIIGSCFGPGDRSKRIHNMFIKGMLEGKAPKLVKADTLHDWIYIDDVANMFVEIGQKSVNMKNYYLGHRKLRLLKDILLEVKDILNPSLEITFGEIEENFWIDYSLVDLDAVYEDTGYECVSDFRKAVLSTAEWVQKLNL